MRIRLLFFALYRDLVGAPEMALEVPSGASVASVVGELRARGGAFAALPAEPAVAVNREYAPLDTTLEEDDEVALLPPVAGG